MAQTQNRHGISSRQVARCLAGVCAAALLATSGGKVLAQSASGKAALEQPAKPTKNDVESRLTAEVQRIVNGQTRIAGQRRDVAVRAALNASEDALILNLSEEYIPESYGADFEDLLHQLTVTAQQWFHRQFAPSEPPVLEVQFRFGGRDLLEVFPEQRAPSTKPKPSGAVAGPVYSVQCATVSPTCRSPSTATGRAAS
jgi:hypothetical protein